jgi:hypothetical protein
VVNICENNQKSFHCHRCGELRRRYPVTRFGGKPTPTSWSTLRAHALGLTKSYFPMNTSFLSLPTPTVACVERALPSVEASQVQFLVEELKAGRAPR